jgi:hypothetical protein
MFRDRRGREILREVHFKDGVVHGVAEEIADIADNVDDSIIEAQARLAWAWHNNSVREVHVIRGEGWETQKMGIQLQLPGQIDLEHEGFNMRLSDPYLIVTGLKEDSFLKEAGIDEGDGIITVHGEMFNTIGEFAALTKRSANMTLQVMHIPDIPLEDEYVLKVRNAIVMRVGHEVKVRNAFLHAHENDLEPAKRIVPTLAEARRLCLEALHGFIDLQFAAETGKGAYVNIAPAPILCAVTTALHQSDVLSFPSWSYRHSQHVEPADIPNWLEAKLDEWRKGKEAQEGDYRTGICTQEFMESYKVYATRFPKDYGRRVEEGSSFTADHN